MGDQLGFQKLPPIPTKEELLAEEGAIQLPVNKVGRHYSSVSEYLGTHFRLLREDVVGPLRRGIRAYKAGARDSSHGLYVYEGARVDGTKACKCGMIYRVAFNTMLDEKATPLRLELDSSKRLMFGALVCLSADSFRTFTLGTVSGRHCLGHSKVEIELRHGQTLDERKSYVMVESASAYFEAYTHVLKTLQTTDAIPFPEHLVYLERYVRVPAYLMGRRKRDVFDLKCAFPEMEEQLGHSEVSLLSEWPEWTSSLDASQKMALRHALTKRLAIIQGPPGTGKTHLGLLLVKILLANLKSPYHPPDVFGPIMVVCTTNHALDKFLEGVYQFEHKVVRVGGRSKSKVLGHRNLRRILKALPNQELRKSENEKLFLERDVNSCMRRKRLEAVSEPALHGIAPPSHIHSLFNTYTGLDDEDVVKAWLDGVEESALEPVFDEYDVDYFRPGEWYCDPSSAGFDDDEDVWKLSVESRRELHEYWLGRIRSEAEDKLSCLRPRYEAACDRNREEDNEARLSLLRSVNVVGMTTTGAARMHDVLMSLKPEIVIVEEAAAVLEGHVLASLVPCTQHLVLIGDHQQLRPPVASHQLTLHHGLDVSLFERLVIGGVEHVMLQTQRRMKPCISSLIRNHIYGPALKDHDTVRLNNKTVSGMDSSLFFVDHQSPEEEPKDSTTRINVGEARMVVGLCRHLLGSWKSSEITVLAMYKGQVEEISRRLEDLGQDLPKVTSVDDFQGEENDIILLSLVRSNQTGSVGFLRTSNRVCVALSRARKGMYIFGNAQLLAAESGLWEGIIADLRSQGRVGPSLKARCSRHPGVLGEIPSFDVTNSFCTMSCGYKLDCGHVCANKCHSGAHNGFICGQLCLRFLDCLKHQCLRLCHGAAPCPRCSCLGTVYKKRKFPW